MTTRLSVIILTYNEEANIAQALDSVCGWAEKVFILDSFSTDQTVKIAEKYHCAIFRNPFENYAKQRNYALEKLPINTEWVMFLDADEWIPDDLKNEIASVIASDPQENGFFIKFRLIWMNHWIRRGYYPTWLLRLFRYGKGRCETRSLNEHCFVEGKKGYLQHDLMHQDRKSVHEWIDKHNRYAVKEAQELIHAELQPFPKNARLFGTQAERKKWLRYHIWNKLPPLIRPFFYFFYRYMLKGGFMDGKAAFIYHFLQGLWFPFLIDVKYLELNMQTNKKNRSSEYGSIINE